MQSRSRTSAVLIDPSRSRPTHLLAITMIATVLAKICAIAPNSATVSVCGAFGSFAGTRTSEPGPGAGLLEKRSDRRRVRVSPLA